MNATQHTRHTRTALHHLARLLLIRGFTALAFAAIAVRWPERTLEGSAVIAGPILTGFAGYEIGVALLLEADLRQWWLLLLEGLACVAFGMITFVSPMLPLESVAVLAAVWLALYGALSLTFMVALWRYRHARWGLAAWGMINIAGAILLVGFAPITTFAVLWVGAFYTAIFGFVQISAAVWLRQQLSPLVRELRATDMRVV